MGANQLLADIQLSQIVLLSSQFEVTESAPQGDAEMKVTVESTETAYEENNGEVLATTRVKVQAELVGKDASVPNMQLEEAVAVMMTASIDDIGDLEPNKLAIRTQAISDAYAFIRNHAMQLAGLSPMSRLILPSIDVSVLIED